MNCFQHPENIAIGVCKQCHKGLCAECFELRNDCLYCKNKHCHQHASEEIQIIEHSKKIYGIGEGYKKRFSFLGVFNFLIGCLFAIFGVFSFYSDSNQVSVFLILMGILFIAYSLRMLLRKDGINF